ncbi:ROK family protein [Amnibacterium sp. CER49]|uniref:ROK family protein n=1 Tax=Amnibacterium sp. CER49 TaxID=3039161 RepID=UPI00244B2D84|nr:ROK family protein [Amnibacterium sp. CER49]MDH2442601.1 ROK family protein [Amnibacterium sp. CER49]
MAVLGVDVGGTAVKTWREDGSGGVAGTVPTPRGDTTGERTADLVAELVRAAGDVTAVGLAVPGIVDAAAGVCRRSVNLGWQQVPIGSLVAARIGRPVVVAQDVRAGAAGERLAGAGRGRDGSLLFAPIGTGLALAWVDEDGSPLGTAYAGEAGQLRHRSGPYAGLRVEEIASAGGLARRFGADEAKDVLSARDAGDARAAAMWTETVEAIAEVLAWAIALTAPATIVVGGGLVRAGDALLEPLRASLAARLDRFPETPVLAAECGTDSAAIGMARLAARV